ncbi:hypothetical protein QFZ89_007690 [Paraburkholderia youngii]
MSVGTSRRSIESDVLELSPSTIASSSVPTNVGAEKSLPQIQSLMAIKTHSSR